MFRTDKLNWNRPRLRLRGRRWNKETAAIFGAVLECGGVKTTRDLGGEAPNVFDIADLAADLQENWTGPLLVLLANRTAPKERERAILSAQRDKFDALGLELIRLSLSRVYWRSIAARLLKLGDERRAA
jgi:hypothetical protein